MKISSLIFSLFTLSIFGHASVYELPPTTPIDSSDITGTYSNSLGYKTIVKASKKDGKTTISFGNDFNFFTQKQGDILTSPPKFSHIENDGSIVFKVQEQCEAEACHEANGTVVLKKKNNGGFYLNIQLKISFQDSIEGPIEIERLASEGSTNPVLEYCKMSFPPVVSHNFKVKSKDLGSCEVDVYFFMKKDM